MRWNNIISCGLIFYTVFALLLTACTSGPQVMDGEDMVRSYTQVSQESEPEAQVIKSSSFMAPIPGLIPGWGM